MKEITELQPFGKTMELVHLPASRIIGLETENGGKLGNTAPALWDKVYAGGDHKILESLIPTDRKDLYGWTMEYNPATKTFCYMVCALVPAGTPVPDGFAFRDIPETLCAVGQYGESVAKTAKRAGEAGYAVNWDAPGCGWNAELYFHEEEENPPKKANTPWHFLVPVKAAPAE